MNTGNEILPLFFLFFQDFLKIYELSVRRKALEMPNNLPKFQATEPKLRLIAHHSEQLHAIYENPS